MRLSIKLPDDEYKKLMNDDVVITTLTREDVLAILPERHGKLIDFDVLRKKLRALADDEWNKSVGAEKGLECALDVLCSMPIYVEADKEVEK